MRYVLTLFTVAMTSMAMAAPSGDCEGTPKEAVVSLPSPLNEWGQIICTPFGHIIGAKEGWIWSNPGGYSPVMIPSQMVRIDPKAIGNSSYFTKIELRALGGSEAQAAIALFETGFDKSNTPPKTYSLEASSVSGKTLGFRFFDFGDSVWGMWCNRECKAESRFMLLNMRKRAGNQVNKDASR